MSNNNSIKKSPTTVFKTNVSPVRPAPLPKLASVLPPPDYSTLQSNDVSQKTLKRFVSCDRIVIPERVVIPTLAKQRTQQNSGYPVEPDPNTMAKEPVLSTTHFDSSMISTYSMRRTESLTKQEPKKSLPDLLIFTGILFSLLLLVIFLQSKKTHDKKGKEAYFDEDPTERTLQDAVRIRSSFPQWQIRTDDWGYFQRAYQEKKEGTNTRWENYDVFLGICISAGIAGAILAVGSVINIYKFYALRWSLSAHGLLLILLGIIVIIAVNMHIFSRIYEFNEDTSKLWEYCACPKLKEKYYYSQTLYQYATYAIVGLGVIQVLPNIIFWCKRPKQVVPIIA